MLGDCPFCVRGVLVDGQCARCGVAMSRGPAVTGRHTRADDIHFADNTRRDRRAPVTGDGYTRMLWLSDDTGLAGSRLGPLERARNTLPDLRTREANGRLHPVTSEIREEAGRANSEKRRGARATGRSVER